MKFNIYPAIGLLLLFSVPQEGKAQCASGYTPYSVAYSQTVNNAFGTEFHQFTIPKFGLSGTFLNAQIRTYVTLRQYDYTMENPNPTAVLYRVGVQKEDFITSPDIPISYDGNVLQRTPNYSLQPSNGVPNSGPDYRAGSMGDVWEAEPVIDVLDGSGYFQGSGNILFELETSTYNPYGNPNVATTYSELLTTFEVVYNYCDLAPLAEDVIAFSALRMDGGKYGLYWNVSEEMPGRKYLVERSNDGKTFRPDGAVNGLGPVPGAASYKYTGSRLNEKEHTLYFRIVQLQADGSRRYSSIKKVEWQRDFYNIDVFPNPAKDFIGIDLRSHTSVKEWRMQLFSLDGKMMQQGQLKTPNGFARMQLNTSIPRGFYVLKATSASGETSVSAKLFVDR